MTRPSPERQRELLEQYKNTPKQMGVYRIRNLQTEQSFVGASRDLRARFNRHRIELKTNAERSSAELQADWNRLGAEAFAFEILEELEPLDQPNYDPTEDLATLESMWLEKLESFAPKGYNHAT